MGTRIKIRFYETDAMGITHHSNYLRFFEVARTDWLKEKGHDYRTWDRDGLNLPLVRAQAEYKRATRFDDELEVRARVRREGARVIFDYEMIMVDSGPHGNVEPGAVVATGRTEHVVTNKEMKIIRLPRELENIFED